jgi:hypothetical protein
MMADPEAQEKRRVPSWTAPITTVDRYATVEETQLATDEFWVSR